ncbi:MAG TPA: hypothetical protein DDZ80_00840 [Cyanobacteria bacterium UBA8803]|nr:hypothetical protein [Cyanobacteria bacterium UBA9273]HBL57157.1 hypothetical protein [Cyanobacteria bacterium UBA8803]
MENRQEGYKALSQAEAETQSHVEQAAQQDARPALLKKLTGGFLFVIGYLLSPLCWWNDLVFNLPIAYLFGYVCSWISPDLLLPCSIAGYWLSNIAGMLLMQAGVMDVFQGQAKERNLKKELLMGVVSSTAYTLFILALVQLKLIDAPILFSNETSFSLGSLFPTVNLKF